MADAFQALTRYQLRDAILAYWNARYLAATGTPLQTQPGSPAYCEAEGIGVLCEPIQARALGVSDNIFPDTADTDSLDHHGTVDGVARKPATAAVEQVQINGTIGATVTFGSSMLQGSNGLAYKPSANADGTGASVVLNGSGQATIYATCTTLGTSGNLPSGTMVWSAIPANATSVVTILALQVTAADVESDTSYAQRILSRRRERPGGGNRADWKAWAESVSNVAEAYVYPLYHRTLGPNTLGAVTVIPLGLAPSSPSALSPNRMLTPTDVTHVESYIEGTADATGVAVANGNQLRPCVISPNDYSIELPSTTTQNVVVTATVSTGGIRVPTWVGTTFTTGGGSSSTVLNVTTNPLTAGVSAGDYIAVVNASMRGGYEYAQVANATSSTIVLTSAFSFTPGAGVSIIASCSNAPQIRDAILSVFDRLGPGDTSPTPSRFPAPSLIGPTTLYNSALVAAVMGVPGLPGALPGVSGVVSATVSTPAGNVTATAKQLIVPGSIQIIPA